MSGLSRSLVRDMQDSLCYEGKVTNPIPTEHGEFSMLKYAYGNIWLGGSCQNKPPGVQAQRCILHLLVNIKDPRTSTPENNIPRRQSRPPGHLNTSEMHPLDLHRIHDGVVPALSIRWSGAPTMPPMRSERYICSIQIRWPIADGRGWSLMQYPSTLNVGVCDRRIHVGRARGLPTLPIPPNMTRYPIRGSP